MSISHGQVVTRGSLNASDKDNFEFVSYVAHKSKKNSKLTNNIKKDNVGKVQDERKGIDIKRARREIIKFGISGFDNQKKQETKIAIAISLGAKPPKNEYKNYKQLLEEKKKEKNTDESRKALQQAGKNAVGASTADKNFVNKNKNQMKKSKLGLLSAYGKVKPPTSNENSGKKSNKKKY